MKVNRSSVLIGFVVAALVGVILVRAIKSEEKSSATRIWKEDMFCLNGACVLDSKGVEQCVEFRPQVVRILVSPEPTPSDQLRMNIVLLDKTCSTE